MVSALLAFISYTGVSLSRGQLEPNTHQPTLHTRKWAGTAAGSPWNVLFPAAAR